MTARVVCMASAKGGSGKTLLTATFGNFLAALGYRVLMVDTDAATNGLSLFYLRDIVSMERTGGAQPRGLFELTQTGHEPTVVDLKSNLDLLAATYEFRNSEATSLAVYADALKSVVARYRSGYDFIFLDAQAGSDEYAQISIDAEVSDQVVIVSEYDPMSAAGVERLKALFGQNLGYFRTWVLLNKMLPDFVESFSNFLEIVRYASPVPWDADVVRAYARRSLALDLERGNAHTVAVVQSLRSLFGEIVDERLDHWLDTAADAIRQPARQQRQDLETELTHLLTTHPRPSVPSRYHRLAAAAATPGLALAAGVLGTLSTVTDQSLLPNWTLVLLAGLAGITAALVSGWTERAGPGEDEALARRREELTARIDEFRKLEELDSAAVIRVRRQTP